MAGTRISGARRSSGEGVQLARLYAKLTILLLCLPDTRRVHTEGVGELGVCRQTEAVADGDGNVKHILQWGGRGVCFEAERAIESKQRE